MRPNSVQSRPNAKQDTLGGNDLILGHLKFLRGHWSKDGELNSEIDKISATVHPLAIALQQNSAREPPWLQLHLRESVSGLSFCWPSRSASPGGLGLPSFPGSAGLPDSIF